MDCIHHYRLDSTVCNCEGEGHFHAICLKCGVVRSYKALDEVQLVETGKKKTFHRYAKIGAAMRHRQERAP